MDKDLKNSSKTPEMTQPTPYKKTLIFCNTVVSCQAVSHYLSDNNFVSDPQLLGSYHGDLNSSMRGENLQNFISGILFFFYSFLNNL